LILVTRDIRIKSKKIRRSKSKSIRIRRGIKKKKSLIESIVGRTSKIRRS
jgi:hypothetical protein